jgi:hypothetical protein
MTLPSPNTTTRSIERRTISADVAFRADAEQPRVLTGYAAVFDTPADIGGLFREYIARGAFAQSILEDDIRAVFNHDPNYVIGRNRAGTLTLAEDEVGLLVRAEMPDVNWAQDLAYSIQRGDINQMSFAFVVLKDSWERKKLDNGDEQYIRTLMRVMLYDVSVVTYPAYEETSAQVRAALDRYITGSGQAPVLPDQHAQAQARRAHRVRKLNLYQLGAKIS